VAGEAAVSRWIPVQVGFDRLLLHYKPWAACELLNAALLKNDVRLRRDGALLSPTDIRGGGLYAHAELEPDGRYLCTIETNQPLRGRIVGRRDDGTFTVAIPRSVWEVDAEGIEALLYAGSTLRRTWRTCAEDEIRDLCSKQSPLLKNFRQLCAHISARLTDLGHPPTKNTHRFHQEIRRLLEVHVK
jgi:hypothetical protein